MRGPGPWALGALMLSGCYQSHARPGGGSDAGADARVVLDAGRDVPGIDAPPEPSCDRVMTRIEVPTNGCIDTIIENTAGNYCASEGRATRTVSAVHVHRVEGDRDWYFFVRSRDPAAAYLAVGQALPSCECIPQASVSGGDLTRSGVGGDLPVRGTDVELVVDGNDRAVLLQMCDGPPR